MSRSLLERIRGDGPTDILQEGPLNDVASCYWLSGRCAERLGQFGEAREKYREGKKLTYARCWNPKTQDIWRPDLKAGDDLDKLDRDGR